MLSRTYPHFPESSCPYLSFALFSLYSVLTILVAFLSFMSFMSRGTHHSHHPHWLSCGDGTGSGEGQGGVDVWVLGSQDRASEYLQKAESIVVETDLQTHVPTRCVV